MILFVVVAALAIRTYTKPELVPGHRNPATERPVYLHRGPREPAAARDGEQAVRP